MSYNLTLEKEHLKTIALEILTYERDRKGLREDMVDLKKELNNWLPKHLIMKVLNVFLKKGTAKSTDLDEYKQACEILGLPYVCNYYQPEVTELTPDQKEVRDKVTDILKRYDALRCEVNELTVHIRESYAKARAVGISVPLLKKLVDFVLHPDKLKEYQGNTPLLEAYIEVIPDIE